VLQSRWFDTLAALESATTLAALGVLLLLLLLLG
jgi:hypothetical protein